MECAELPSGLVQVTFPDMPHVDKVHAEALCVLLRQQTDVIDLASHAMDQSVLKLNIRLLHSSFHLADTVKDLLKKAASQRAKELEALRAQTRAAPVSFLRLYL
jgi:hypothetical protein